MPLSTHVLDTSTGEPAVQLEVVLERIDGNMRRHVAKALTDADGRIATPFGGELAAGTYELVFNAAAYFAPKGVAAFYDTIPIRFVVTDPHARYHVPLLLSPWGYTTYRGS
jgi:5-hydroxyisourate hydrolase